MAKTDTGVSPRTPPSRPGIFAPPARSGPNVRRSTTDDVGRENKAVPTPSMATGVLAFVTPGRGRGDRESNGRGFLWRLPGSRPRSRSSSARRGLSKDFYRLSIDLERPSSGRSVWVKSRKSCVLEARMARASSGHESDGVEESRVEAESAHSDLTREDVDADVDTRGDRARVIVVGIIAGALIAIMAVTTWLWMRGVTTGFVVCLGLAFVLLVVCCLLVAGEACCCTCWDDMDYEDEGMGDIEECCDGFWDEEMAVAAGEERRHMMNVGGDVPEENRVRTDDAAAHQ